MNLRIQIEEKYIKAIKSKNSEEANALRLIKSAIKDRDIANRTSKNSTEIDDQQILTLLQSLIKQRKDSIDLFKVASRDDLVAKEQPVYLRRIDGHAAWVNSKVLSICGINDKTKDPDGWRLIRDKNGVPTGIFIDKAIEYSKSYGGVFIGAHHCTLGSGTSDAAKRVWKSLTRDYTSSGDVIFIGTTQ